MASPMQLSSDEEEELGLSRLGNTRLKSIIEARSVKKPGARPCPALKRLRTDLDAFKDSEIISAAPHEVDPWAVRVMLQPEEGYYALGRATPYPFVVRVSEEYPYEPPEVWCEAHIFHPNVDLMSGRVCLPHLQEDWTPILSLSSVFNQTLELLEFPEAEEAAYVLNQEAAALLRLDTSSFVQRVMHTASTMSPSEQAIQNGLGQSIKRKL